VTRAHGSGPGERAPAVPDAYGAAVERYNREQALGVIALAVLRDHESALHRASAAPCNCWVCVRIISEARRLGLLGEEAPRA
jgi:hypothetical protein